MAVHGDEAPSGSMAVAVAVSGSRSELAVRWAAQNLIPDAHRVLLLHVIPCISAIPDSSGRLVPIGEVMREVMEVYERERRMQTLKEILPFKKLCRTKKEVQILLLDGDCPADVLLKYVSDSRIENLVLGGSSWTWFKRILKRPDMPTSVLKAAPSSLNVFVVSRHSLIVKMANQPVTCGPRVPTRQKTFPRRAGSANFDRRMSISRSFSAMRLPSSSGIKCPARTRTSGDVGVLTTDVEPLPASSSSIPQPRDQRRRRFLSNVFLEKHDFLGSFRDKPVIFLNSKSQGIQREDGDQVERLRFELRSTLAMYNRARRDLDQARQQVQTLSAERLEEARRAREALRREETMKRIAAEEKAKHLLAVKETRRLLEKEASSSSNRPEPEADAMKEDISGKPPTGEEALFSGIHRTLRRYSRREIESATDFFAPERKIGEGGFGHVYKAVLDHTPVAIKALREDGLGRREEFLREVEVLSQLRHPHLLLLLGACSESGSLVYEYMENGSLEDKLFRRDGGAPLPWFVRVRVVFEVACGLAFLHGSKPEPIVHRDLKPGNILLDRNLVSKIGDVGLAKLVPRVVPDGVTVYKETVLAGTLHYMDPEYQRTGTLRPKSDLYAFGVVVLQVLTAAPPMGLVTVVNSAIDAGRLAAVLDLSAPDWPQAEAEQLAHLGIRCCRLRCRDRPDLETEIIPELARLAEAADSFARLRGPSLGAAPAHFFCPILKALMENPYIAADGFSYEHRAIRGWIEKQAISPVTGFELQHTSLTPNHALRSAIQEWKSGLTTHHRLTSNPDQI